jgi:hypothetical protein
MVELIPPMRELIPMRYESGHARRSGQKTTKPHRGLTILATTPTPRVPYQPGTAGPVHREIGKSNHL